MLTQKYSSASKLHGESQHGNLQHCLSQENQHSIIRTIFATDITGRCQDFRLRRRSERRKSSPRQVFVDFFRLVLICFVDGGQLKRVILASVKVQGLIQREGFSRCFTECWTSRSHDPSFFLHRTLFLFLFHLMLCPTFYMLSSQTSAVLHIPYLFDISSVASDGRVIAFTAKATLFHDGSCVLSLAPFWKPMVAPHDKIFEGWG